MYHCTLYLHIFFKISLSLTLLLLLPLSWFKFSFSLTLLFPPHSYSSPFPTLFFTKFIFFHFSDFSCSIILFFPSFFFFSLKRYSTILFFPSFYSKFFFQLFRFSIPFFPLHSSLFLIQFLLLHLFHTYFLQFLVAASHPKPTVIGLNFFAICILSISDSILTSPSFSHVLSSIFGGSRLPLNHGNRS